MKNFSEKYKKMSYLLVAVLLATWIFSFAWFHGSRNPASIPNENFFEFFKPEKLNRNVLHKEIVSSLQIAKNQKEFQIQIRNFLVKENNANEALCSYFNEYTLTFEAEGIASSGERPTLTITAPCLVSDTTKLPFPIHIPVEDIFKLKPTDTDVSFQVSKNALFSFKNIYDTWPEYWVLSRIQFDNNLSVGKKVVIERKEIFELSQKPITMEWNSL